MIIMQLKPNPKTLSQDIAGLEHVKKLVAEMVVWPMLNPHLFRGVRAPPKGLLLFGPPGGALATVFWSCVVYPFNR